MASTRTGGFGIGFRRGWSDWQKDLAVVIDWARDSDFECLDVAGDPDMVKQVVEGGLAVGSVDVPNWGAIISADKAKQADAVAAAAECIKACAAARGMNFFACMVPDDPAADRKDNFKYMVEGFGALMPTFEAADAKLVIEGWPGPGALCCTPETYRAFFDVIESDAACVNYDPSHLIRMGIDPIMFLNEFAGRVCHVHGKDTEILAERQYDLGTEQPATFAETIFCGGGHWRYTIPGHGQMRWIEAFRILDEVGYTGFVSIELEDANFNGTEAGEKAGLVFGRQFLESC